MTTDVAMVLERLIAERGDTYARISQILGRNPAYIQQFIRRGIPRRLREDDRHVLACYFGVSEALLGGRQTSPPTSTVDQDVTDVVKVRRISLGASAGAGSLEEDQQSVGLVAFDPDWLRRLGVEAQHATMIRVDGESMMPTLNDGDDILVNHADGPARLRDGVYVLRLDGALMVKRIALGPLRGRLSIRSDNPLYPDWADLDLSLLHIVGRVIWTGRRI